MASNISSSRKRKVLTASQLSELLKDEDDDYSSDIEDLDCSITDPDYQPEAKKQLFPSAESTEIKIDVNATSSFCSEIKKLPQFELEGTANQDTLEPSSIEKNLENGEEVYLLQDGKRIFKATYECSSTDDSVHFQVIAKNEGRFFITKVYLTAASWKNFDEDLHCVGAAILWNLTKIKKEELVVNHEPHGQQPVPLVGRNRKRNEKQWKQNIKKQKVNSGGEYTYKCAKTGAMKTRPARSVKKSCPQSCKRKCQTKIRETERSIIHGRFWQMGSITSQAMFLINLVQSNSVKRVKKQASSNTAHHENSRRTQSFKYYFETSNGERIQVCKTFFLGTLDISEKRIRTALSKKDMATVDHYLRGTADCSSHNEVVKEREEAVIEHIQSFTTVESHYVRAESDYCYLPAELNVKKMHKMYLQWCRSSIPPRQEENYDFYRRVFYTRFKLKFHVPKKDQCDTCESFKNTPLELKTEELEKAHDFHVQEKNKARDFKQEKKEKSKQNPSIAAVAFDFQKTLLAPNGEVSSFYYSMRLKTYNFTLTKLDTNAHTCYVYTEEDAKKGSCEVASFLLSYLQELKKKGITTVQFFCDRCSGQNCNRQVFIALSYALQELHFDEIGLNFLVTGHSQNENDSAHAKVEIASKGSIVYSPFEWQSIIRNALKKNSETVDPVVIVNSSDIVNFKSKEFFPQYKDVLTGKTVFMNSSGKEEEIKWSKLMQLCFVSSEPNKLFFKYNYSDPSFNELKFLYNRTRRSARQSSITQFESLPELYQGKIGINVQKKKDLQKLCNKLLIPTQYHDFYNNLVVRNTKDKDK